MVSLTKFSWNPRLQIRAQDQLCLPVPTWNGFQRCYQQPEGADGAQNQAQHAKATQRLHSCKELQRLQRRELHYTQYFKNWCGKLFRKVNGIPERSCNSCKMSYLGWAHTMQSSHNSRGQAKCSLSERLVKARQERCSKVILFTWCLKASLHTLKGKQAPQLETALLPGHNGSGGAGNDSFAPNPGTWASKGELGSQFRLPRLRESTRAAVGCRGSRGSPRSPNSWSVQANVSQLRCHLPEQHCWEGGQALALVPLRAPFQAALSAAAIKRSTKMVKQKDTTQGVKRKGRDRNLPGTQLWQVLGIAAGANRDAVIKGWVKPRTSQANIHRDTLARQNSVHRPEIHGLTAEAVS